MTCRSCGATIAAKAIVCFRCGAPTAEPAVPAPRPRLPWARRAAVLGAVAVIAGLGIWLIPLTPEGSWARGLAWAAVPLTTAITVRLIRGPRSGKLLRR